MRSAGIREYVGTAAREILRMDDARPIQRTDYDTSWVAGLSGVDGSPHYRGLFDALISRQRPDGSWGGHVPYAHDRILTTLSVMLVISRLGGEDRELRGRRKAGEAYIRRNFGRLSTETHETIGFEMILPRLLAEGRESGLELPYEQLRRYETEREEKLRLIPGGLDFESQSSPLFSLEAFSDHPDLDRVARLVLENGSVATSPSATAAFLASKDSSWHDWHDWHDWRKAHPASAVYLDGVVERYGSGIPTIDPSDIFVRAWSVYYLRRGNLESAYPADFQRIYEYLSKRWKKAGVGWAGISLPESDDTSMVLMALRNAGHEMDGGCLLAYEREEHFAVLEHERNPSVSANLHILEAVDSLPNSDRKRAREKILNYLFASRVGGAFWTDKWHVSPFYPTSRALIVLSPYAPDEMLATARWLFSKQRPDGGWGEYASSGEETALVLLALLTFHRETRPLSEEPLKRAARHLIDQEIPLREQYPELWVSKALYAPRVVIKSLIIAALNLSLETLGDLTDGKPDGKPATGPAAGTEERPSGSA